MLQTTMRCTLSCLLLLLTLAACRQEPPPDASAQRATLRLIGDAFEPGNSIPTRHTCTGEGISPSLAWRGAPEGTKSFALIAEKEETLRSAEDPLDPGTVLWIVFNIPPEVTELSEGLRAERDARTDHLRFAQGENHQGTTGYAGPCPSVGDPGRYTFRIYALNAVLPPGAGLSKQGLRQAMEGHILAEGELVGIYRY